MPSMNAPLFIKVIWIVHFTLFTWAVMGANFFSSVPAYWFTQIGMLGCGFWAVVSHENIQAVSMFAVAMGVSIFNDILLLSIYQSRADQANEGRSDIPQDYKNEYRWALGMSILNVIFKPLSLLVLILICRGSDINMNIPGLSTTGGQNSSHDGSRNYQTIESAQDSHPGIYGRNPYQNPYQNPPPSYETDAKGSHPGPGGHTGQM